MTCWCGEQSFKEGLCDRHLYAQRTWAITGVRNWEATYEGRTSDPGSEED